jgi:ribonucleoside-diphosphate reductase alpha chain
MNNIFFFVFRSICTIFSLREKVLSLERTKKNKFSFGSLLAYSYLCRQITISARRSMIKNTNETLTEWLVRTLAAASQQTETSLTEQQIKKLLDKMLGALTPKESKLLTAVADVAVKELMHNQRPDVTEVRPKVLECDVVRFQNNKDKWVALVGLLDGYPYEIFTGLQDDDDGILLPKSVTKGKIIKQVNEDGTKRYDFQFENTRGYKITVEGLSEKFNPEYWNYAKLISGVLRYRMPLEHVIKLVSSLQLQSENINTWKVGVERALKKYIDGSDDGEQ